MCACVYVCGLHSRIDINIICIIFAIALPHYITAALVAVLMKFHKRVAAADGSMAIQTIQLLERGCLIRWTQVLHPFDSQSVRVLVLVIGFVLNC